MNNRIIPLTRELTTLLLAAYEAKAEVLVKQGDDRGYLPQKDSASRGETQGLSWPGENFCLRFEAFGQGKVKKNEHSSPLCYFCRQSIAHPGDVELVSFHKRECYFRRNFYYDYFKTLSTNLLIEIIFFL